MKSVRQDVHAGTSLDVEACWVAAHDGEGQSPLLEPALALLHVLPEPMRPELSQMTLADAAVLVSGEQLTVS